MCVCVCVFEHLYSELYHTLTSPTTLLKQRPTPNPVKNEAITYVETPKDLNLRPQGTDFIYSLNGSKGLNVGTASEGMRSSVTAVVSSYSIRLGATLIGACWNKELLQAARQTTVETPGTREMFKHVQTCEPEIFQHL